MSNPNQYHSTQTPPNPNVPGPISPVAERLMLMRQNVAIVSGVLAVGAVTLGAGMFGAGRSGEEARRRLRRTGREIRADVTDMADDVARRDIPVVSQVAGEHVTRSDQHTDFVAGTADRIIRSATPKPYDPLAGWEKTHRTDRLNDQFGTHAPNHRWYNPHGANTASPTTLREEVTGKHLARVKRAADDQYSKVITPFLSHYAHMFPEQTDFTDIDSLKVAMDGGRWRNSDVAKFWRAHKRYLNALASAQGKLNDLHELAGQPAPHDTSRIPRVSGNPNNTTSRVVNGLPGAVKKSWTDGSIFTNVGRLFWRPKRGM